MKLSEYLEENGIMQKFFANKIGVSEATIHSYTKKGVIPPLIIASKICEATHGLVKLTDWLEEKSVKTPQKKNNKKRRVC